MLRFPSRGLYAVTQTEGKSARQIINDVSSVLRGGVQAVQYRDKNPHGTDALAIDLVRLCREFAVPLIINDDIELAARVNADGVHLGKDDASLGLARQRLGKEAIIGVSCYNSVERAMVAQAQGATYVAFGRFFPSSSKPLASPAEVATLKQAKQSLTIPIVAIGGILTENGGELLAAGADVLAVIGGLFNRDPEQSALAFQVLFDD